MGGGLEASPFLGVVSLAVERGYWPRAAAAVSSGQRKKEENCTELNTHIATYIPCKWSDLIPGKQDFTQLRFQLA